MEQSIEQVVGMLLDSLPVMLSISLVAFGVFFYLIMKGAAKIVAAFEGNRIEVYPPDGTKNRPVKIEVEKAKDGSNKVTLYNLD